MNYNTSFHRQSRACAAQYEYQFFYSNINVTKYSTVNVRVFVTACPPGTAVGLLAVPNVKVMGSVPKLKVLC